MTGVAIPPAGLQGAWRDQEEWKDQDNDLGSPGAYEDALCRRGPQTDSPTDVMRNRRSWQALSGELDVCVVSPVVEVDEQGVAAGSWRGPVAHVLVCRLAVAQGGPAAGGGCPRTLGVRGECRTRGGFVADAGHGAETADLLAGAVEEFSLHGGRPGGAAPRPDGEGPAVPPPWRRHRGPAAPSAPPHTRSARTSTTRPWASSAPARDHPAPANPQLRRRIRILKRHTVGRRDRGLEDDTTNCQGVQAATRPAPTTYAFSPSVVTPRRFHGRLATPRPPAVGSHNSR